MVRNALWELTKHMNYQNQVCLPEKHMTFFIIIAFLGSRGLRNILTWMRSGKAVKHSHHAVQRHLIFCRWGFTKWKWHSGHKREPWHVCWERHLWQHVCSLFLTCLRSRLIQDMETVRETQHIPVSALLAESLPAWHNAYSMRLVSVCL